MRYRAPNLRRRQPRFLSAGFDPNLDAPGNPDSAEAGTDLWDLPNAIGNRLVNEIGKNRLVMYCPSTTTPMDVRNETIINYCWNLNSPPPYTTEGEYKSTGYYWNDPAQ